MTAITINEKPVMVSSTTIINKETIDQKSSPSDYIRQLLPGRKRSRTSFNTNHKITPSLEQQTAYCNDAVRAIRSNDISSLRQMLDEGHSFDACNRNGETLLHLACRRSNLETVQFLIHEAHVPIDVCDSMGRTPLHDVCWRPRPDLEMMALLIRSVSPDSLLCEDMRGHCCFDYCRKGDWSVWSCFLEKQSRMILFRARLLDSFNVEDQ